MLIGTGKHASAFSLLGKPRIRLTSLPGATPWTRAPRSDYEGAARSHYEMEATDE